LRLVLRAGRRALWRHPVQLLLAVAGVAVGVAVVVAVGLANQSAREAMHLAVERVAGAATHQIVGGPEGLSDGLYRRLRVDLRLRRVAPVVEGGVTVADAGNRPLRLLGLDPFAEAPFRDYLGALGGSGGGSGALVDMLVRKDRIALSRGEAASLHVGRGDVLRLRTPAGVVPVHVAALIDAPDRDLSGLAFADVATAQSLLGRAGRLSRIDLILEPGQVESVRAALPPGVSLIPAASRSRALGQMSSAFHLNLTALSLLALVVGLFLVFNTMNFLVVQRRPMLGTLRAVGVTRRQIFAQVLADAALVGVLGTAVGVPLGIGMATGLVELVLRTINDLYFHTVGGLDVNPASLLRGLALGLAGTVAAAVPAAREAVSVPPHGALSRGDLEVRARRGARVMAGTGVVALGGGGALLYLSPGLFAGFAGLFAIIIGTALLVPLAVLLAGRALQSRLRGPLVWRLALGGATASLSRTGVAVASLSVAVSAVIGVAVMIGSFRGSVEQWLRQSLAADFYVSAPAPLDDALADRLAGVDGVRFVTRSRHYRLPTADGFTELWALGMPPAAHSRFQLLAATDDPWAHFRSGRTVFVSEPLAYDHHLQPGDALVLRTAEGRRRFRVAAVFRDYGAVQGVVLMRRALYRRLWHDDRLSGIGVHAAAGVHRGTLEARLKRAVAGVPGARVRDNRVVYRRSMAVFDQTFTITSVLRLLAAVVAFVGVLGALMALQLDRAREYATLRALGLTRRQLGGLLMSQSGLLGLAAGLAAVPLGVVLAALLVFVINRRAFGWTMGFVVHAGPLAQGVGLAVFAALLAALYPAWRAARRPPADGLKEE